MRTGSIYIIKNTVNDKVYIGQTTMTVHERFMVHMKPSTAKLRRNYKLYNAVTKYGRDKFYVETLEDNVPLELLNQKEIEYITMYNSFYNGYNSTKGGDGRIINKVENEDELLSLAKSGVSADNLALKFSVNKATVFRTLHKTSNQDLKFINTKYAITISPARDYPRLYVRASPLAPPCGGTPLSNRVHTVIT